MLVLRTFIIGERTIRTSLLKEDILHLCQEFYKGEHPGNDRMDVFVNWILGSGRAEEIVVENITNKVCDVFAQIALRRTK